MTLQTLVEFLQPRVVGKLEYKQKKALSELAASYLNAPPGLKAEASVHSSILDYPPSLSLEFEVDDKASDRLRFPEVYRRAYEQNPNNLYYEASVSYDPEKFVHDARFDIRAFEQFSIHIETKSFSIEPLLIRKERNEDISLYYETDRRGAFLNCRPTPRSSRMWQSSVRSLAERIPWKVSVSMKKEDKESLIKGGFWERLRRRMLLGAILSKKDYGRLGVAFFGSNLSPSYEGEFTLAQMDYLEQLLQSDLFRYAEALKTPVNPQIDSMDLNKILKSGADIFKSMKVPGTEPEKVRITREQARKFMEADIKAGREKIGEIPASSLTKLPSIFGLNKISYSGHYEYFENLKSLTGADWKECFDRLDGFYSNDTSYAPESPERFISLLRGFGIPEKKIEEVKRTLSSRKVSIKHSTYSNGFLKIGEIYELGLSAAETLLREKPDETLGRYMELYRDPKPKVEIEGDIGGNFLRFRKLFHPGLVEPRVLSGMRANFGNFTVSAGLNKDILIDEIALDREYVKLGVDLSNPQMIPVQQYVLDTLGVSVKD